MCYTRWDFIMILLFPFKGQDKGHITPQQPEGTSPELRNVRPYDVLDNRARGGQRPGLDKIYSEQISGITSPIIAICSVTIIS